jgi:hypothetical protein
MGVFIKMDIILNEKDYASERKSKSHYFDTKISPDRYQPLGWH